MKIGYVAITMMMQLAKVAPANDFGAFVIHNDSVEYSVVKFKVVSTIGSTMLAMVWSIAPRG